MNLVKLTAMVSRPAGGKKYLIIMRVRRLVGFNETRAKN